MSTQYYVAVKDSAGYRLAHVDIITAEVTPTRESHGNRYEFAIGGFPTKMKAVEVAMYQNYVIDSPERER